MTGVDCVITVVCLIALLAIGLYLSWRSDDEWRREQRLWQRGMRP